METVKLVISLVLIAGGMFMFVTATIGANRFRHALNRIHAAALGDTLGIGSLILGLMVWKGFSMVTWKMLCVLLFFWLASPVCGHMLARMERETGQEDGELLEEKR